MSIWSEALKEEVIEKICLGPKRRSLKMKCPVLAGDLALLAENKDVQKLLKNYTISQKKLGSKFLTNKQNKWHTNVIEKRIYITSKELININILENVSNRIDLIKKQIKVTCRLV